MVNCAFSRNSSRFPVVVARIADALGIPLELIGDSREMIDVAVSTPL
jgi:hypothetical protein